MGRRVWTNGVLVDTGELTAHAFLLSGAGVAARPTVEAATRLAAQRVTSMARARFIGTRYWRSYPRTVTSDVEWSGTLIEAEVGPRMGRKTQGSMGHWLEFGTSRQGPIKPHLGPALEANRDVYEKALLAAITATTVATIP